MNDNDVLVSIICTSYNQENYIEKALMGMLMQKTTFKFEIIIHDDASSDKTAEIIKSYEVRYPELIHAIYQSENQYSKGVLVDYAFMYPVAKGKYYAFCEGDDYWTDEYKLQKQVEYMEEHPECSLTAHSGKYCYEDGTLDLKEFRAFNQSKVVTMDEICTKWLFPTASLVCRASLRNEEIPFAKNAPCGDVPLVMYAGLRGTVYYFDEKMCVYRKGAKHSLTTQWKKNKKEYVKINLRFISMLDQFDEFTNKQYEKAVDVFRISKEYNNLIFLRDIESLKSERYHEYYGKSIKRKIVVWLKVFMPNATDFLLSVVENAHYYICLLKQMR